jgi:hypothetical protein
MTPAFVTESVPHIIGGLVVAVILGLVTFTARQVRRRRPQPGDVATDTARPVNIATTTTVRTYVLLTTEAADGRPVRIDSTRTAGNVITYPVRGRAEQFLLTDARLHDGNYAAEPLGVHR